MDEKIYPDEKFRATGRTYRMMLDAVKSAMTGTPTTVILATEDLAVRAKRGDKLGIEFLSAASATTRHEFDWTKMKFKHGAQNHAVFVDHYAIELMFGKMLKMLHEYDSEGPVE